MKIKTMKFCYVKKVRNIHTGCSVCQIEHITGNINTSPMFLITSKFIYIVAFVCIE